MQGHLGLAWINQKATGTAMGESIDISGTALATESEYSSKSSTEWVPVIGIGMGYHLNSDWQLQLNWRRVIGTKPGALGKQDQDLISTGLKFKY